MKKISIFHRISSPPNMIRKPSLNANLQALLKARRHFDALPENTILSSKSKLAALQIPNYIEPATKTHVLGLYRRLHRAARLQMDPLCRHFLRTFVWESFAAYRHTTDTTKLQILIRDGSKSLQILELAIAGDLKAITQVMDTAYSRYNVQEGPLKRLLRFNRLDPTLAVAVHKLTPPSGILTFDQYAAAVAAARSPQQDQQQQQQSGLLYFKFIGALKSGPPRLSLGYNDTKINFEPPREGTITGAPLPVSRERNIIARRLAHVLKAVKRPFDEATIAYLELMAVTPDLTRSCSKPVPYQVKHAKHGLRFYRRRIMDTLEHAYSLFYNDQGKLTARVPDSNRIKTSVL